MTINPEYAEYCCVRCIFAVSGPNADEVTRMTLAHDAGCLRASYSPAPPLVAGRFITASPQAPAIVAWMPDRIRRGAGWWGHDATTTAMGALVPVADDFPGHVAPPGWPVWVPRVIHELYEADTGAPDEQGAAAAWFADIAQLLASPVDYDAARHHFLAAVMRGIVALDTSGRAATAAALHERAMTQYPPAADEWKHLYRDLSDLWFAQMDCDEMIANAAHAVHDASIPYDQRDSAWRAAWHAMLLQSSATKLPDRTYPVDAYRDFLLDALRASAAGSATSSS